jgi:hypothetical protein
VPATDKEYSTMNRRHRVCALLAGGMLSLAGCASAGASGEPATSSADRSPAMSAGMVMPDGSTMGAAAAPSATEAGTPSAAEKMVCAAETHSIITEVLGLAHTPTSTATWRNHLYTCTYRLPMGTLIVSVKQSSNPAAAAAYFQSSRTSRDGTKTLDGLGEHSYGTTSGTVVLIKDSDTLTVDATRLPPVFGKESSKRSDFAYELASDILGCWTEG